MRKTMIFLSLVLSLAFSAWASETQEQAAQRSKHATGSEGHNQNQNETTAAQYMADPQIAQMLKEINSTDIEASQLAQKKASSNSVKVLAQQIEKDHKGLAQAEDKILKRLKMTPSESDSSKAFSQASSSEIAKLKDLKGSEFDNAYLHREIAFHQRAKDLVEKSLLPNAKDTGLKELLAKTNTVLDEHLQHTQTNLKQPH